MSTKSTTSEAAPDLRDDIRLHCVVGFFFVVVVLGGFGALATTAPLSGAVIADGTVVVTSNVKSIEHPTGGTVAEIRVKNGDKVSAGDLLLRLDETVIRANLQVVLTQLDELGARQARLIAERDGQEML